MPDELKTAETAEVEESSSTREEIEEALEPEASEEESLVVEAEEAEEPETPATEEAPAVEEPEPETETPVEEAEVVDIEARTEQPISEPGEAEPEPTQEEQLRGLLNQMARDLQAARAEQPAPAPAEAAPQAPPSRAEAFQTVPSFTQPMLSADEYDEALSSVEGFNKALAKTQERTALSVTENLYKSLPVTITQLAQQIVTAHLTAYEFYQRNPDLRDSADIVAYIGSSLKSTNPDWDDSKLFLEVENAARRQLGRPRQTEPAAAQAPPQTASARPAGKRPDIKVPAGARRAPAGPKTERELIQDLLPDDE